MSNNRDIEIVIDLAPALPGSWPSWARTWQETGSRPNGWPDDSVLTDIKSKGGNLVRKKCETCSPKREWRMSFPYAQRKLIGAMSQEQKIMIVIIKALRRSFFQFSNGVTSYHIETLVLWMVEKSNKSDWFQENLHSKLNQILVDLYRKVKNKNLPSYFMLAENLFEELSSPDADLTLEAIDWILKNPTRAFPANLLSSTHDDSHVGVQLGPYSLYLRSHNCNSCISTCERARGHRLALRDQQACRLMPIYQPLVNYSRQLTDTHDALPSKPEDVSLTEEQIIAIAAGVPAGVVVLTVVIVVVVVVCKKRKASSE